MVTWYVTGNNISLRGDTPRRCMHIRLETPEEKPEHRTGFRHPRLLSWLLEERGKLLPAALTLLTAFQAAGRPAQKLRPWGSFEDWSDLIRDTIVWLGLEDPANTCEQLASAADVETSAQARLLDGLAELLTALDGSATASQILRALEPTVAGPDFSTLRAAIEDLFPRLKAGELPTPVQLGAKLRALRGRVLDGLCVVPRDKTRQGIAWAVERGPRAN